MEMKAGIDEQNLVGKFQSVKEMHQERRGLLHARKQDHLLAKLVGGPTNAVFGRLGTKDLACVFYVEIGRYRAHGSFQILGGVYGTSIVGMLAGITTNPGLRVG
jgi:hypothetical protein